MSSDTSRSKYEGCKTQIRKTLIGSMFAFVILATPAWADFTAKVNTQSIAVDDVFELTLSTTDNNQALPDLSPLERDFQILGMSQSRQTHIVNMTTTTTYNWVIALSPKVAGQLTVPALNLGSQNSAPIVIDVLDSGQTPAKNDQSIDISASISKGKHYIFQEIPLTVRIETSQPITKAELIMADIPNVDVRQEGQDRITQVIRNGQPIGVVERKYILSPQVTGPIEIPSIVVRGTYPRTHANSFNSGGAHSIDELFNETIRRHLEQMGGGIDPLRNSAAEEFVAKTKPITINIQANPNGEADWFLPAKSVVLSAKWLDEQGGALQSQKPTFKEGEAVTREISLLALGAEPEQLPKLDITDVAGLQIYTDSDITEKVITDKGAMAKRTVTISIIPEASGSYTLPEIAVQWHNTDTDTAQTALLESETIEVTGATAGSSEVTGDAAQNGTNPDNSVYGVDDTDGVASNTDTKPWSYGKIIGWLVGLSLAGLFVAIGWSTYRKRRELKTASHSNANSNDSRQIGNDGDRFNGHSSQNNNLSDPDINTLASAKAQLNAAVANTNVEQVYQALLSYQQAGQQTLSQDSLHKVKTLQQQLENGLYGAGSLPDFQQVAQSVQAILSEESVSHKDSTPNTLALPSLYPN